jgi:hypothetical protein
MVKCTQPSPGTRARRGAMVPTVKRLAAVAAMAAALTVVTTTPVEASSISSITCGFGTNDGQGCGGTPTSRLFFFGSYGLILDFGAFGGGVIGGFDVTFADVHTNQSNLQPLLPAGAVCVPIAGLGPGDNCVVFSMLDPLPVQGVNFTGDFRVDIFWFAPTDDDFPDGPNGQVRLLHDSSLVPGGFFGADVTIPGSYFAKLCKPFVPCDPGIGGRDNNFQNFVVVQFPAVPEPATLVLVVSGIGSLWYQRRRRRGGDASAR